mgnify:CR=1 FL=1
MNAYFTKTANALLSIFMWFSKQINKKETSHANTTVQYTIEEITRQRVDKAIKQLNDFPEAPLSEHFFAFCSTLKIAKDNAANNLMIEMICRQSEEARQDYTESLIECYAKLNNQQQFYIND